MNVDIRIVGEGDLEAAHRVRRQAFNEDESIEDWKRYLELERLLGAWVDGRLVGIAETIGVAQFYGGRAVPTGAVSDVAVLPEYRGAGIAARLMDRALADMHERGECSSVLHPATTRLYRGLGYELGCHYHVRKVALRSLDRLPAGDPESVRRVGPEELDVLRSVYERVAPGINGFFDRPSRWWRRIEATPDADRYAYVVEGDDGPRGYVVYRHVPNPESDFYRLRVHELVAADPDALVTLWRLLASHSSLVDSLTWRGGPDDPLLLILPEQEVGTESSWACLSRIVDVRRAVATRGFAAAVELTVPLRIVDRVLAHNDDTFVLRVEGGRGELVPGGDGVLELDVKAFASIFTGYASANALATAGLLRTSDRKAFEDLQTAFAGPTPWFPDFF